MQELGNIREPRLQELAAGVPRTLRLSRAESTVQKYTGSFDRWKKWAAQYPEISEFPAQPAHVALYLQHLLETSEAKTAVDDAVNALAWVHELGGLPSPMSYPTVRTMQESAHKREAKGEKGTSNTTVDTENGQYVSPGVSIVVGHTNCDYLSPGFLRIFPFQRDSTNKMLWFAVLQYRCEN